VIRTGWPKRASYDPTDAGVNIASNTLACFSARLGLLPPVEGLVAIAPGLDRGRNSDFGGLGRLIVGGFREANEDRSRLTLWLLGLRNNAGALDQGSCREPF
jgi:hypothetical protein